MCQVPIIIGDFPYVPSEGKDVGGLKEGSSITVSKLNDDIQTSDLPRIGAELEEGFPPIDYMLAMLPQISCAGAGSIRVLVARARS